MFTNKKEFIESFTQRIIEKYGRTVEEAHITEKYMVLGEMVRDYASINWKDSKRSIAENNQKVMFYFSMEFLIGRLLTNNLMNLGIYDLVKESLAELDIDINQLEDMESDAGLGNGGLGRLAACFLDSLASLNLPGHGNTIRYEYGHFKQLIVKGYQVEVPDQWLALGNIWEVRKPKHAVDVKFWGRIDMSKDKAGNVICNHVDCEHVKGIPYDMPVIGCDTKVTNSLRLWRPVASEILPKNKDFRVYLSEVHAICQNVYPDDSTEEGQLLRLKQEYFLSSASIQAMVKAHIRVYGNTDNFAEKTVIQLNDTHLVLAIPELMRVLMDEHKYDWDKAWNIVSKCFAYTNHTVMREALERWPIQLIQRLLPRIYMIIEEINYRYRRYLKAKNYSQDYIDDMMIINDYQVHMANLAIVAATSVNGVAELHTKILTDQLFANYYHDTPEKFNNKTNGISHRRWLLYSNPQLTKLLDKTIGKEYHNDPEALDKLMDHVDEEKIQREFLEIKKERKVILADYISKKLRIKLNVDSIFDVQAKRLHAYKRQLMNIFYVIYLYQRLKENREYKIIPQTFIFAAKAAPSYVFAKAVIKLINEVAKVINADDEVNKYLKVVFIPNYQVSLAEILTTAADVSEQISTAGKEASGTGNMKFMMNGAITLGTLDGANVEINDLAGEENNVIFGLTEEEVRETRENEYQAWDIYNEDEELKAVVDSLVNNTWILSNEFKVIFDELMYGNDEYLVLKDFRTYVEAHKKIQTLYQDKRKWAKMALTNIARSGYFSSDRTIREYTEDIWKIEKIKIK